MEVKQEAIDRIQEENMKIKQEPVFLDSPSVVKLEPKGGENENESVMALNPVTNVKVEAEHYDEVVANFSSSSPVDDIKEVQVSDFFVSSSELSKIKQEVDDDKTLKTELLNEECDLKSEVKVDEYFEQPCSSKHAHEVFRKPKQSAAKKVRKKKYPCPVCNKNFESATSRKKHIDVHFQKGYATCTMCGIIFNDKIQFFKHSLLHTVRKRNVTTKPKSYVKNKGDSKKDAIKVTSRNKIKDTFNNETQKHKCEICSRELKTRKTLLAHIKNHSIKSPKCKVCLAEFKNKLELKLHMLMHKGRTPLKCDICSKEFLCKSFLDIHYRFHSGEKPFQCEICSKQFLVKSLLDHHMFVHKGIKPFKCEICSKEFTHKPSFDQHVRKHNRPDFYSVEIKTECDNGLIIYETQHVPFVEPRPHICEICSKSYRRKQELKKHMRNHTGERPYECPICQKRFTLKPVLQTHIKVHSGEKPYTCEICSNKFSQKKNLTDHYRTHTGEKPFKCEFCPKDFFHRKNLKEHILKHTGEKPYKCEICYAEFAASRYLRKHAKIHIKEQLSPSPDSQNIQV